MDRDLLSLKGNLDFARTRLVRASPGNVTDQERASPLSWVQYESKEGNAVCVSSLISREGADFPPLIVAIKGERVPPTIGDLLAVYQPSVRTLAVRFQKAPEERYVIPIEVLTSSWEAAITACRAYSVDPFIPGTDHVYTWDRYLVH